MKIFSYRIKINKNLQEDVQQNPFINSKNKNSNTNVIKHLSSDELEIRQFELDPNNKIIDWINNEDDKQFSYEFFIKKVKELGLEKIIKKKIIIRGMLDFNWKFNKFKFKKKKILSLGSGDGLELLFLRIYFPDSEIFAVDWVNKIDPKILSALQIKFDSKNLYDYLKDKENTFDFIYSSHVLEHSYEIDFLFSLIHKSLVRDGLLASNLPLCSFIGTPYYDFLKNSLYFKNVKQIDGGMIDLGHAWKTNEYDLYSTLEQHEFKDIKIYLNSNQITRMTKIKIQKYLYIANLKYKLNFFLIKPFKFIIHGLFGNNINYWILKIYHRIFRELPISDNRIANYNPEALFIAKKNINSN